VCPPETAQQLQQQIPTVVIEQAHQSLLQAQLDLAILACNPASVPQARPTLLYL
jgi:glutamate racemase